MSTGPGPHAEPAGTGGRSWWPGRPHVLDIAIVAALLVPYLVFSLPTIVTDPPTSVSPAAPWVLGIAVTAANLPVLWRRRAPWTVLGLILLAGVPMLALGGGTPGLAVAVLAHTVGHRGRGRLRRRPGGDGAVVVAAGLVATVLLTALAGWVVGGSIAPVAAVSVGAATGLVRRELTRRDVERRERADAAAVEAALAADRRRIGAELHEVVRARLVEIVSHADRARAGDDAPEAALAAIARDTRGALTALREMLALLRSPDAFAERSGASPANGEDAHARRMRWPAVLWSDVVLVLVLAAAVPAAAAVGLAAPPIAAALVAPTTVLGWLLLAAAVVPVAWRRHGASVALAVVSVPSLMAPFVAGAGGYGIAFVASAALTVTAASRDPWRWWVPVIGAGLVGVLVTGVVAPSPFPLTSVLTSVLVPTVVLVGWGLALRWQRTTRSAGFHRQREARATESRRAQRLRIARDLHDVVAHHVSGMAVQAGTAHALAADRPDLVSDALAHVQETGRSTLAAMPALLEVLDERDGSPVAQDIDRLTGPLRAAGAPVEVEVTGTPEDAGQVAGEVLWLVQEALTNVLRHAGPAPTRVSVRRDRDAVEVTVCDEGPVGGHRADPGGGFGLVGMRERVAVLGGEIAAGPSGTGWRVHARLPYTAAEDPAPL